MPTAPKTSPVSPASTTSVGFLPGQVFYDEQFNMYVELTPAIQFNGPGASIGSVIIRDHSYHLNVPEMLENDPVVYNSATGDGMDPTDGYTDPDTGALLNDIENYQWSLSANPIKPIYYKVEPFLVNDDQGNPAYVPRWLSIVVYPKGYGQPGPIGQDLYAIEYLDPASSAQSVNPNVAYQYDSLLDEFVQLNVQPDSTDGEVTYPNGSVAGNTFTNFTYQTPAPRINQSIQSQTPTGLIKHTVGAGSEVGLVFEGLYYYYNPEDIVKHYDVEFKEL